MSVTLSNTLRIILNQPKCFIRYLALPFPDSTLIINMTINTIYIETIMYGGERTPLHTKPDLFHHYHLFGGCVAAALHPIEVDAAANLYIFIIFTIPDNCMIA